jgi:hypothetical protein
MKISPPGIMRTVFAWYGLGILSLCLSFLQSCRMEQPTGEVLVRAPNPGTYEIYRIESEEPLQFVSEQIGQYNQPLKLTPGRYLILADCSYETLTVLPQQTQTLIAHQVLFNPPVVPNNDDNFSIQCNRFTKTKSRQHLHNRYTLNILHGSRDLLVGMIPMSIDFSKISDRESPQILSYNLSGIKIASFENMKPSTSFFVSPADGLLSITETQEFGHWQFLLKGRYRVEVNGTKMDVDLGEGQQYLIQPAFLRIGVSDSVDIHAASSISGTPSFVELNEGHWLDLNETYPVLPGDALLKLNGSLQQHSVQLTEGQLTDKRLRSVLVDLDCSAWDWTCLGSREIFLYETEKTYPFAEGTSDVPLLFFEEDVWLSIQGSRDIRYKIPTNAQDTRLKVGFLKLTPQQLHRPGQVTDLSRIEAAGAPLTGHSLDLPLDGEVLMPLVVGRYHLAQYNALATADWDRRISKQAIQIQAQETIEMPYYVYVSEKKLKQIRELQAKNRQQQIQKKFKLMQSRFRPVVPTSVE